MSNPALQANRPRKDSQPKESDMPQTYTPDNGIPLSLDEALSKTSDVQAKIKALKAEEANLKQVAKIHMKERNLKKYESPKGIKAQFIESQRPKFDKDAILTLTGEDFGLCVSYSTSISFKVS